MFFKNVKVVQEQLSNSLTGFSVIITLLKIYCRHYFLCGKSQPEPKKDDRPNPPSLNNLSIFNKIIYL